MEVLQMDFSRQKPTSSLNQKGFVLLFMLPLLSLFITGILGLSLMSLGIKNITFAQKHCLLENLSLQKKLKRLLTKLLSLNSKSLFLNNKRKILESALKISLSVGAVQSIPVIKKKLFLIKMQQKRLLFQQKKLLTKGELIRKKSLRSLKQSLYKASIHSVKNNTLLKKALAVSKKRIGKQAFIYKPLSRFSNRQKNTFSWKMQPFFPLWKTHFFKYKCTATLEKKGPLWKERLFY